MHTRSTRPSALAALLLLPLVGCATTGSSTGARSTGPFADTPAGNFTRQDRLRGSVTPEREWWDLLHYRLDVEVMPETKRLAGSNAITFKALKTGKRMQVDLQPPLEFKRVAHEGHDLEFKREGNVYWIDFPAEVIAGSENRVEVFYEGAPVVSKNPPWSGGLSWDLDDLGRWFISTTCQGIGASIWWPNKDHGYDEPDRGMDLIVTVPEALVAVGNGRLVEQTHDAEAAKRSFHWRVTNPINNYAVNMNIAAYVSMPGKYKGEGGTLDVEYWTLEHQQPLAREQFKEVPRTLEAFEHWFGKYPFYEDSYKLVCVRYLGMEHQSSVTYGNGFQNGYRGTDLSASGVGLKFDFIVVHETAHEWFGNNVSCKDAADLWIHESFANYAENLFVEYHFSEAEAQDYVIGCRARIKNDSPIVGVYGMNAEGSGDMYYKGGNMLHTLRHVVNDTDKWRRLLRGINSEFWHQTITSQQLETYISEQVGLDLGAFFDQYLRTTMIPVLAYEPAGDGVRVWWKNVVPGFELPVLVRINGAERRLRISEEPAVYAVGETLESFELDRNFYMTVEAQEAR